MRSILVSLPILTAAWIPVAANAAPRQLQGCRPVDETIRMLRPLTETAWAAVSRDALSRSWTGLQLVECEPRDDECARFETCHCDRLQHLGRTIDGAIHCADTFFFDVTRAADGRFVDRLDSVALVLSSASRKGLEADVERLRRSIACPELSSQSQFCLVDVRIERQDAVWSAWLHWSRGPLDAGPLP